MNKTENSDSTQDSISKHDLVKSCIALADHMNKRYEGRRALEWKIHLAVWTLLVVCGYAFLKFKLCLTIFGIPSQFVLALYLVLFCSLYLFFCYLIRKGESLEHDLSVRYREKAAEILKFKEDKKKRKPSGRLWILFQGLTTFFLALMIFIIGYNNCRNPQFADVTIEKKIGDLKKEYEYNEAYQEYLGKNLMNVKELLEKLKHQTKKPNESEG